MEITRVLALITVITAISSFTAYKFGYKRGDNQGSRRGFARGIAVSRQIISQVSNAA